MRVIGKRRVQFTTKDGTEIDGYSLYLGENIPPDQGEGEAVERAFFSKAKLAAFGYTPKVDDEVEVLYNRYGKPYSIREIVVS